MNTVKGKSIENYQLEKLKFVNQHLCNGKFIQLKYGLENIRSLKKIIWSKR